MLLVPKYAAAFSPPGVPIKNTGRGSYQPSLKNVYIHTFPRSHSNPTNSTRLPRESIIETTGLARRWFGMSQNAGFGGETDLVN